MIPDLGIPVDWISDALVMCAGSANKSHQSLENEKNDFKHCYLTMTAAPSLWEEA
jgi:hypothetical protein